MVAGGNIGVCFIQGNSFSRSLVYHRKFDRNQDHTFIDETMSYMDSVRSQF